MIIADTSGLLALFNRSEPSHEAVAIAVASRATNLVVSPYVVAELDYLVSTRAGVEPELALLTELAGGAYVHPHFAEADIAAAARLIDEYRDLSIGIADASLVVLAQRYDTRELLTLDHRHFRVVRPIGGGTFNLIPA